MKEDLSIDQILKSIRQVILGKKSNNESYTNDADDVYELTEVVNTEEDENLISEKAAKEAAATLSKLADIKQQKGVKSKPKQTSIEDLVVELIRPYLADWLDQNLPRIVKTLVDKEINRIMSDEKNNSSSR